MNAPVNSFFLEPFVTGFWKRVVGRHAEFLRRQTEINFFSSFTEEGGLKPAKVVTVTTKRRSMLQVMRELRAIPLNTPNTEHFDQNDLAEAHYLLFHNSLESLTLSGRENEKCEILAWIFAPDIQEKVIKGKIVKVSAMDIPFSFYRCARESGITNVDGFKSELVNCINTDLADKLKQYFQHMH